VKHEDIACVLFVGQHCSNDRFLVILMRRVKTSPNYAESRVFFGYRLSIFCCIRNWAADYWRI